MERYLHDRQEIRDLVVRYCHAVDRRELDSLREIYIPGGIDHHTGFSGPVEEYIDWLKGLLPRLDGTLHVVGNHLAHIHGDYAIAETYATAYHWGTPADDETKNFTTIVRYVDDLVRYEGQWRIKERWAVREYAFSEADRALPRTTPGPLATHGQDDPYTKLAARFDTL